MDEREATSCELHAVSCIQKIFLNSGRKIFACNSDIRHLSSVICHPSSLYLRMKSFQLFFFLLLSVNIQAQSDSTKTKHLIDSINRRLDRSVVIKDLDFMQKHYAVDFIFTHATGKIDSKKSWISKAEGPTNLYKSREHDSVIIELHNDIAIVKGIMTVVSKPEANRPEFYNRYIRVYALRKNTWQLISNHGIAQWNK